MHRNEETGCYGFMVYRRTVTVILSVIMIFLLKSCKIRYVAISESEIPHEDIPAIQREWFSLQELEAGLCNITYHRNCSDMEETSEHFLCVHGRFYEYNGKGSDRL